MKLIYITGIDGCGKTTQSKMLTDYLIEHGTNAQYQWLRWSPSIGKLISLIKKDNVKEKIEKLAATDNCTQIIENKTFVKWADFKRRVFSSEVFRFVWSKYATWDYYFAYKKSCSSWNSEVIVLDRYYFDFIVDQSLNYEESPEKFESRIGGGILKNVKKPDVFILIDITPEIGWDRKRDGTSMTHLRKLYVSYNSIKSEKSVYVIDGSMSSELVRDEIINIIKELNLSSGGRCVV